jgi:hypothetical protein
MKNFTLTIFLLLLTSCGGSSNSEPFKEGYFSGDIVKSNKSESYNCSKILGSANYYGVIISKPTPDRIKIEQLLFSARVGVYPGGLILEADNEDGEVSYTEINNNEFPTNYFGSDHDFSCMQSPQNIRLKMEEPNIKFNSVSNMSCIDNLTRTNFNCKLEESSILTPFNAG